MCDLFACIALVCAGVNLALASFIYHQDPDRPINRLAALRCVAFGLVLFVNFQFRAAESFTTANFWQRTFALVAIPSQAVHFHFVWSLLFQRNGHNGHDRHDRHKKPDQPASRWRTPYWLVLFGVYAVTLFLGLFFSFGGRIGTPVRNGGGNWTIDTANMLWDARAGLGVIALINIAWITLSIVAYLKSKTPTAKRQQQFVLLGMVAPVMFDTLVNAIPPLFGKTSPFLDLAPVYYTLGSMALIYGIVKYRVFTLTIPAAAREIVSAMSEGLVLVSPQQTIQAVNPALCTLLGYHEEELIDQPITLFCQNALSEQPEKPPGAGKEASLCVERQCYTRSGQPLSLLFSGSEVQDRRGNLVGIVYTVLDMTTRRQAEEMLRESRALYHAMFEKNTAIKLLVDPQTGAIVDANPAASVFYGYSLDELRAMNIATINVWPPHVVEQAMQQARAEQRNHFFFRHRLASGEQRDVEVYSSPIPFQDRTILLSIVHDVTDRVRAEQALRESEERHRLMTEHATDMICRLAPDGTYLYVSPASTVVLGLAPDEMVGQKRFDLYHPDDTEYLTTMCQSIQESMQPQTMSYRMLHNDGSYIWLETTSQAVRHPDTNDVVEIVSVSRNITERKQIELELERSLALLRATIESTADGILVISNDFQVIHCNQRFLELWGLPETWLTIPAPDERLAMMSRQVKNAAAFLRNVTDVYKLDETDTFDMFDVVELNDGRIFERYTAPYRVGGDVVGRIWNFRDHTERHQAQTALQEVNQQLTRWVTELEQYNRDITLLNGMGDALQLCEHIEEAYQVIKTFASQLFPQRPGVLYMLDRGHTRLDMALSWGDMPTPRSTLPLDDCSVFRQVLMGNVGNPNEMQYSKALCVCQQEADPDAMSLCVPLIAQGEPLGLFRIVGVTSLPPYEREQLERLAKMVAEHLAMALANLFLRDRLHYLSIHDPLTGLFNRRYLDDMLEREILHAAHQVYPVGVIMLDIDHFKRFNDTYGHKAGDALLQALGAFLKMNIRSEDMPCRYGGEEFTLILPGASLENTRSRAALLCERVRDMHVEHEGVHLGTITMSLGVACFPDHGLSAEQVIGRADDALYQAKLGGRNQVRVAE